MKLNKHQRKQHGPCNRTYLLVPLNQQLDEIYIRQDKGIMQ